MIYHYEYYLFIIITSIFITYYIGNRLNLYTNDFIRENLNINHSSLSKILLFIVTSAIYILSAIIWILAKLHFPFLESIISYYFRNKIGLVIRTSYWKARLKKIGKNVIIDIGTQFVGSNSISIGDRTWIDKNVILIAGKPSFSGKLVIQKENKNFNGEIGNLIIGKYCHIAPNVLIQAHGGVEIGDFTGIASGSKIYSQSHHYKGPRNANTKQDEIIYKFTPMAPRNEQCIINGAVVFKGNNALGLNSSVLPGVTIGKNSWIGVNSFVIKDIPPNTIASGSPAIVIKKRFN